MEVHFTPELEAKLTDTAAQQGRNADELAQEVVAPYFDEEARFIEAVKRDEAALAASLSRMSKWASGFNGSCTPDGNSAVAAGHGRPRADLRTHYLLPPLAALAFRFRRASSACLAARMRSSSAEAGSSRGLPGGRARLRWGRVRRGTPWRGWLG